MKTNHKKALRLHTHRIVFTANDDIECALRALLGQSTRAIEAATGLSGGQVNYRVHKAGINRWDFRNGQTHLANQVLKLGRDLAYNQVKTKIAPKFEHLTPK